MTMIARLLSCLPVRVLGRFRRDQRGAVAIVTGIAFPLLVGGMALGTEAGFWYLSQRKMQQGADLLAYTAAVQLRSGRGEAEAAAAAGRIAEENDIREDDTLTVNVPPKSGAWAGSPRAAEVLVDRAQRRFFTLIYASDPVALSARAVAVYERGSNACLLALDPTAPGAITVSGSSTVVFEGCDVATNSNDPEAFLMSGGSVQMTTGCVHSVGGAETTGGLTLTTCEEPNTQAPVMVDPYADVPEPAVTGPCLDGDIDETSTVTTITPTDGHELGMSSMHFCGGLDLKGRIHFDPGLYIVDGGTFRINAQAEITGTDVTFFLTGGARIHYNGGADISLAAPTSGPLSGLMFFGARDDVGVEHTLNGTAGSEISGAIYVPSGDLAYSGNFTGDNGCTQIVMRRVTFTGNSELQVDCTAEGARRIAVGETIRLVE